MKNSIFTGLIALIICCSSCNVVDDLLTFSIDNQTNFKIESAFPVGSALTIVTPEVTTNSSSTFENNNTRADLVKDVKLSQLRVSITNPSGKNFSFLKSIVLYISTDANDEIELAQLDNINSTTKTLDLICTTAKLDKYVKASTYKIRTQAVIKETITEDITVNAAMKFRVTADPF